jgi:hypothetical protein
MRTTLTIDDDIAAILKQEMVRKGASFREIVNRALRRGLAEEQLVGPRPTVKTRPHAFGFKPGFDRDKLNQLVDDLEAEEFASKRKQTR